MPTLSRTINKKHLTFDKIKSVVSCQLSVVRKAKGFTLIELLVVIVLIGILATFGVVTFNKFQQMGRDAKRKSDLDTLKKALELAKGDSLSGTYYPYCEMVVPVCQLSGTNTAPDLSPDYIKSVPKDPKNVSYVYVSLDAAGWPCNSINCAAGYYIQTCLENVNDPQKDDVDGYVNDNCLQPERVSYR